MKTNLSHLSHLSAWLSYFAGDSITITEVFKYVSRQRDEGLALEAIAHMEQGKVIPLDSSLAIEAAKFGIDYKLPLADSIIYATGQKFGALLDTRHRF